MGVITFHWGWRNNFIGLLLGQFCYMESFTEDECIGDANVRWMHGDIVRDKIRNEDMLPKVGVASLEEKMWENCYDDLSYAT